MASVINKIKTNDTEYNIASTAYATCTTPGSTPAKVAYIQGESATTGFTLIKGVTVHVKFTYANKASNPTLNINGTGAKAIKCTWDETLDVFAYNYWEAGEVVTLTYDGTYWQVNKSMPNYASLMAYLEHLEGLVPNEATITIGMNGSGSLTHSGISDSPETASVFKMLLATSGTSMGHAYWDSTSAITNSNSTGGPLVSTTSTMSNVFYYRHNRIGVAIKAGELESCQGKTLTGLDLYFTDTSVNASGYTCTVYLEEMVAVGTPVTGDTTFKVYEMDLNNDNISTSTGGLSVLHITFDNPFYYQGSNLSMLIKFDSTSYNSSHNIYGQITLYYS